MQRWQQWTVVVVSAMVLAGCAPTDPPTDVSIGLDPQCDELLKQMCDTLRVADGFDVTLDATYMDGYGEALERVDAEVSLSFRRPGFMYVTAEGIDTMGTLVWHTGQLTVVNEAADAYAQVDAPEEIDGLVEFAADEKLPLPLGALLSANPYAEIVVGVEQSYYLGTKMLDDRMCHHMVFIGDGIDWEIWLDEASQGLPAKWVVTYKYRPGMPRRIETFTSWLITKRRKNWAEVPPVGARPVTLAELLGTDPITPREMVDEHIEAASQDETDVATDIAVDAEESVEELPAEVTAPKSDVDTPCGDDVGGCAAPAEEVPATDEAPDEAICPAEPVEEVSECAAPARPMFEEATPVEDGTSDVFDEAETAGLIIQPTEPTDAAERIIEAEPIAQHSGDAWTPSAEETDDEPADDTPAEATIEDGGEPVDDLPADDEIGDGEIEPTAADLDSSAPAEEK